MGSTRRSREWVRAFRMIRKALAILQSDEVQQDVYMIPPEEISRIEEVIVDLQETIVDLERTTEERFYIN